MPTLCPFSALAAVSSAIPCLATTTRLIDA